MMRETTLFDVTSTSILVHHFIGRVGNVLMPKKISHAVLSEPSVIVDIMYIDSVSGQHRPTIHRLIEAIIAFI